MMLAYPLQWHRKFDFLPLLGLQIALGEEKLEVFHINTMVSIQEEKRLPREVETEFGKIKVVPALRNTVSYDMGNPDPRNRSAPVSQREILDDIMNNIGGAVRIIGTMPDVVIKSRAVVEKLPKGVEHLPAFQGAENVFYYQEAYGNFVHRIRRALGIYSLANPYSFMKAELLERGVLRSSRSPVFKKLRSTLKTQWLVTDTSGYSALGDSNILIAEQFLTQNRWWTDIGRPTPFQIPFDSSVIQGQIFQLLRRNMLIFV